VPQEHFPVLWLGRTAVISLPVEIDITNAGAVREDLLSVLNREPATLIVDMSGTTFCDSAGVNALVRAHRRATASETKIRLVLTAPAVLRVLAITGVDRLIKVYPSVAGALDTSDRLIKEDRAIQEREAKPGQAGAAPDPEGRAAQPG
jgi:anti-anti-sigma factor